MHISELRESRFLKKEEVGNGMMVTIRDCYQENVAKQGAPEELKWVLAFNEIDKPMVLNSVNGQLIAQITGSENSEDWNDAQIELYNDPNIMFGGKLTGGIRVCAPGARPPTPMQRPQRQAPRPTMQQHQQRPAMGQQMQGGIRQARPFQQAPQQQYQQPMQQGMNMPPADMPTDDDVNY